jgi:uncharacterized membrane protein YkoI
MGQTHHHGEKTMRSSIAVIAFSGLMLGAGLTQASEDIGPDRAVKLLESGTIKSFDELNAAALATHPDGLINDTELENEHGRYVYKVELRDGAGFDWDVEIDASTAAVLSDRRDD